MSFFLAEDGFFVPFTYAAKRGCGIPNRREMLTKVGISFSSLSYQTKKNPFTTNERIQKPGQKSVLYATDREHVALVVVAQYRIAVVVVQVHIARVVVIVLCRTPEVRVEALEVEIAPVVAATSRQRREREGIRAIAITIPPGRGLEFCTGDR